MTWQRRQRAERAVAQALRVAAPELLCKLAGCAPEGEVVHPAHPRLAAALAEGGARCTVLIGRCGRCGELIAHDGRRMFYGQ